MLLALALAIPAMAAEYDQVILNGRVMDPETMFDAIANVGIKADKIAVLTKPDKNLALIMKDGRVYKNTAR